MTHRTTRRIARTTASLGSLTIAALVGCAGNEIRAEHYAVREMTVSATPGDGTVLPSTTQAAFPSYRSTDTSRAARARR